jgi:hypothetical protein
MHFYRLLLLLVLLGPARLSAQPNLIRLSVQTNTPLAENIYGLFQLNCQVQLLQDSAYALYMPRTKKVQIRLGQSDWVEYYDRFEMYDVHDYDPYTWRKNWVYQVPIDLSYIYLKSDSTLFEAFAPSGGKVWLKFGTEFVDTSTHSRVFIESDSIQVQVPPCSVQEMEAFKKLRLFRKEDYNMFFLLLPNRSGARFGSKKYFKVFATEFPDTIIGTMAKCNLAKLSCREYRDTAIPTDIQTQIDQIYQELSTHPSAYIRMQADKQIKCHN